MGDAVNTPWDVLMYFLILGGAPMLIVGIPLAVIALLDWRIQRRLRARPDQAPSPIGER